MIKDIIQAKNIAKNIIHFCELTLDTKYVNKPQFLHAIGNYISRVSPDIMKQKILRNTFPKTSISKEEGINLLKDTDRNFSSKIIVENTQEKTNLPFLVEAHTTSNFVKTSEAIQSARLNSEQTKPGEIAWDLDLCINGLHKKCDIKAGNNMGSVFKKYLGQIAYTEDSSVYKTLNNDFSLNDVQEKRLAFLESRTTQLHECIKKIDNENKDIFIKNVLIQEELFKFLHTHPEIKLGPSFYYGINVPNELCSKPITLIENITQVILKNPNFLNGNRKEFCDVMREIIKTYDSECEGIISNIENSKAVWMGSGLEMISDNLFK